MSAAALAAAALAVALPAGAQPGQPSWQETKCARYKAAWVQLEKRRGLAGLSPAFLSRHDAFLAQGCRESTHVCPRSEAELEVADMMVVAAMNGGMASTFPPFSCRR